MNRLIQILSLAAVLITWVSCESDKRYPPKGYFPNTPVSTEQLEAQYFWEPQDKLSSNYWKDASYVSLVLTDKVAGQLYGDGILNANGTYNGLAGFNKGHEPKASLKAGYDDDFLYVLLEWKDTTLNASYMSWLWQGPNDALQQDDTTEWTSQQNQDCATLLFSTEDGTTADAWMWGVATTAPFDMAVNLAIKDGEPITGADGLPFIRNIANPDSAYSGPKYEWNDQRQEFTLPDGSIRILDPAYYLADAYKTPLLGDVKAGAAVFNYRADCRFCHGFNGDGIPEGYTHGGRLQGSFINKYTRQGLIDFVGSSAHEGAGFQYWGRIKNNPTEIENMVSFMRSQAGIPGVVLSSPTPPPHIHAQSNVSIGGISDNNSTYKVLFKRSLKAPTSSDLEFNSNMVYRLQVRLSDNDGLNYVGSNQVEIVFKSNKL